MLTNFVFKIMFSTLTIQRIEYQMFFKKISIYKKNYTYCINIYILTSK